MMINNDAKEDNDKSRSGDLGKAVNQAYSLSKMKEKGCARLGVPWRTGKSLSEIDISQKASLVSSVSPSIKGKESGKRSCIAIFPRVPGLREMFRFGLRAADWHFLP